MSFEARLPRLLYLKQAPASTGGCILKDASTDFVKCRRGYEGLTSEKQEDAMRHIRIPFIAMLGIFALAVPGVRADSMQLKNGNMVQGRYLGGTEHAVQFEVNGKVRLYDIGGILSISFAASSADGGIPSNSVDPKPGDNTASDSGAILRTASWDAAQKTPLAAAPITPERDRGASRGGMTSNSKAKARVAAPSARTVYTQRERFPVLSD